MSIPGVTVNYRLEKLRQWLLYLPFVARYFNTRHVVIETEHGTIDVPLPNPDERRLHVDTWEDRGARL